MNAYQKLGIQQYSHPADIKLAYQTLMQAEIDQTKKLDIAMAYQELIDPVSRFALDASLACPRVIAAPVRHIDPVPARQSSWLTVFVVAYILGFAAVSIIGAVAMFI